MPPEPYQNNQSDHDLLVELKTEMRAVRADIKELKDNTTKRVDALEVEKINSPEVYRMKTDADKVHDDLEKRIRSVEHFKDNITGRWAILAVLATLLASALISLLIKHY